MAVQRPETPVPCRPISLTDVAAKAGVSKMSVSRVVNQDPRVSPATLAKVNAAIKTLGFVPKSSVKDGRRRLSRSCQGMHHGRIATLIPEVNLLAIQTPLTGRLLIGIDRVMGANNLQLVVTRLPEPRILPSFLTSRQVDGAIIHFDQSEWIIDAMASVGIPAVYLFGVNLGAGSDNVNTNDAALGRLAAKHLILRGSRRLYLFDHRPNHEGFKTCDQAFKIAAIAAGIPCQTVTLAEVPPSSWPTHILGHLPDLNHAGLATLATGHLNRVLSEIAHARSTPAWTIPVVTCSHDFSPATILPHPVTNLDIQAELLGQSAVEALIRRLGNRSLPGQRIIIPPLAVEIDGKGHVNAPGI